MDEEAASFWDQKIDRALPWLIGGALVLAMTTLLYFASIVARDQSNALYQQQRSYQVVALARSLDAQIAKAESSLARYVISMDKDIGRQYQDQWSRAGKELTALRRVTRTDPAQHELVAQLALAYRERGETLNDIALRTTYDQKSGSLGKFYQASKADNLVRITSLLEQVIKTENDRLQRHNLDVARAGYSVQQITTTYRLVGLILVVALLLLIWFARTVIHERRQEQRLIDDEYYRAQMLEAAVAARTEELQLAYAKLKQESADRAKIEQSLRQMQKMEAVGQLTGGIAHDFNNMLAIVVGGLELARLRADGQPEIIRHIDNAMEGANRASALTRRLLAFARAEPNLPDILKPDELIRDMIELLDRSIGDQIRVELDLDAGDWRIHADRHQLENALLNLAVNARDAMDGRGTLILRTRQARLRAQEIEDCPAGEYLCLSVIDNGCGMAPEVLERVFEPFFTTRAVGKGTGLGLSQIFGFVGQAGGQIRILSKPNEGTEVQLYLPRHHVTATEAEKPARAADAPAAPPMEAPAEAVAAEAMAPEPSAARTGLNILVVEDDPRVLAQTRSALTELGHAVTCCPQPGKAEEMLREHGGIQLIISDVLMPDMTGPEMIAALPSPYRSIPVIFVTGYAGDVTDNSMFEGHLLLRKPYTLKALQAILEIASSRLSDSQPDAATA
ncbi:histidine kinase [Sphingobium jiangsuense]|uniref:histidine kinase n=1 Tax=Sphingobium jiangsuense TaxID=870476 RepID=A0A7W6BGP0_9SPHN|nr:ATP-binding protein [Sphingobium jiangsuense]MBB3926626.1 signal transduction histidine kinase [Sphingobium jiangsuense]GLT01665.1 histidine kinase [Sphingobium jiangsuense]